MKESTHGAGTDEPSNLEELIEQLQTAATGTRVSIDAMLEAVGRRSYGPLILFAGVVTLSPVGDIPGVPTLVAVLVLLVSVQLIWGRRCFWLPRWLLSRSVRRDRFLKSVGWLRRPAAFIDKFLRPRLPALVEGGAVRFLAAMCAIISVAMPLMEFVPFSATGAGAALTAFGLAVVARDGLMAALALVLVGATSGAILSYLL